MRFQHTNCGGEIDVKKRQCVRCKKKWDPISFRLDPTSIRPMVDKKGKLVPGGEDIEKLKREYAPTRATPKAIRAKTYKPKSYAGWLDRVPKGVDLGLTKAFVGRLPKWPRWVRVLTTIVFVAIIVVIVLLIRR